MLFKGFSPFGAGTLRKGSRVLNTGNQQLLYFSSAPDNLPWLHNCLVAVLCGLNAISCHEQRRLPLLLTVTGAGRYLRTGQYWAVVIPREWLPLEEQTGRLPRTDCAAGLHWGLFSLPEWVRRLKPVDADYFDRVNGEMFAPGALFECRSRSLE